MNELYFSPALVEGLGRTIVHSLWQATLLAGILWVVSRTIRSARWRYRLAYGTLLAQLSVSVITFVYLYEPAVVSSGGEAFRVTYFVSEAVASGWSSVEILPVVVLLWVVALLVGVLRLGWSFGRVRRMRRKVKEAVPVDFTRRVRSLAERIGYTGKLRLAVSDYVDGPALVGHLKPLLLFPVSLLNQLSAEEAEAVILHELAHLQRQDHWWNLLQCVIEVLFQYHPMVWWIGARIREEREHCCDDVVLEHGPGGLPYAKALLYFESQRSTPSVAVALTNNPGGLLGRVQRFLHHQNIPYQMKSRLFLLPLLALIALGATAAYAPDDAPADDGTTSVGEATDVSVETTELASTALPTSTAPAAAPEDEILQNKKASVQADSLPAGTHTMSRYRNGESMQFTIKDRKITKLKINEREIPAIEFSTYEPEIEKMLTGDDSPFGSITSKDGINTYEIRSGSQRFEFPDVPFSDFEFEDRFEGMGESFEGMEESFEGMGESFEGAGERLEFHFEDIGDNFENLGEDFARMGERMGERFEEMFQFDSDRGTFFMNADSIPRGTEWSAESLNQKGNRIFLNGKVRLIDGDTHLDGTARDMSAATIILEKERESLRSEREEIREMQEQIRQLQQEKAQMQRDLDRQQRDVLREQRDLDRQQRDALLEQRDLDRQQRDVLREQRDAERSTMDLERVAEDAQREKSDNGPDFKKLIESLRSEGLIPDHKVTKFKFDNDELKINGKKMSSAVHARFLEIYREAYGEKINGSFEVKLNNNKGL